MPCARASHNKRLYLVAWCGNLSPPHAGTPNTLTWGFGSGVVQSIVHVEGKRPAVVLQGLKPSFDVVTTASYRHIVRNSFRDVGRFVGDVPTAAKMLTRFHPPALPLPCLTQKTPSGVVDDRHLQRQRRLSSDPSARRRCVFGGRAGVVVAVHGRCVFEDPPQRCGRPAFAQTVREYVMGAVDIGMVERSMALQYCRLYELAVFSTKSISEQVGHSPHPLTLTYTHSQATRRDV